ncbi:Protein of unknown function (DUF506) [Quillaja saponaria]|uniref:Uncharacterized protein n=1 Tax=Quillaja saponaria TaxID=32244 RepID=A0AAD7PAR2_QUISA|nr:Protein of unknown function (DUF506) [Quillaja saponaria]
MVDPLAGQKDEEDCPKNWQLAGASVKNVEYHRELVSFADTVFGFLEDIETSSSENSSSSSNDYQDDFGEDENRNFQDNKVFWEQQDQLLKETLFRTTSIETKIRHATNEALKELNLSGKQCICQRPVAGNVDNGCRDCLQREICNQLLNLGYNCAICKSKWKTSKNIPSGEHTYLEVMDTTSSKKGEIRIVIEFNFRAEFEMARANEEYNQLISRLPEVFVGKAERMKNLIKILCSAAKKCMKEKKMHLGPWRKQKYMQAKWLGTCERSTPASLPGRYTDRQLRPRTSMLTFDLLENLSGLHRTVVEVA